MCIQLNLRRVIHENILRHTLNLGLPDQFIEHGDPDQLLSNCGLDAAGLERSIQNKLAACSAVKLQTTSA